MLGVLSLSLGLSWPSLPTSLSLSWPALSWPELSWSSSDISSMNKGNVNASSHMPSRKKPETKSFLLNLTDNFLLRHPNKDNRRPLLVMKGTPLTNGSDASPLEIRLPFARQNWRRLRSLIDDAESAAERELFPWRPVKAPGVDCRKLFAGDDLELQRVERLESKPATSAASRYLADSRVAQLAAHCPTFLIQQGFILSKLTEREANFSIAYTVLTYKNAEQVMMLLRAIYRPQNVYCIHVDNKSSSDFQRAIGAMAECFPNVFLCSQSVDVRWGRFSVLAPELYCMKDLWQHKKWKYLINLTGQEFPLKTNSQLVDILTAFNGSNNVDGSRKRAVTRRWAHAGMPPWGIVPTKGSVHVTVHRDFVDFILHSRVARDFLMWSAKTNIPDEVYFTSLNHNPHLGIPGTYTGEPESDDKVYRHITRFKNWGHYPHLYPCAGGKWVRQICILSAGDLPLLSTRSELFANKFHATYSRVALECLGERIYNTSRDEFLGKTHFDATYYANLVFVKNQVINPNFQRTP